MKWCTSSPASARDPTPSLHPPSVPFSLSLSLSLALSLSRARALSLPRYPSDGASRGGGTSNRAGSTNGLSHTAAAHGHGRREREIKWPLFSHCGGVCPLTTLHAAVALATALLLTTVFLSHTAVHGPLQARCTAMAGPAPYMGTSLIRNNPLLGPYSRTTSRAIRWP